MIGSFFANPNSIIVPVFQSKAQSFFDIMIFISPSLVGCFTYEFESTYPAQLNGIISPEEYRQSIENINRHIPRPRSFIIAGVLSLLAILTGFIFIILGTVVTVAVQSINLPVLTYVGAAAFPLGMIAGFVSCCVINCKNSAKLIKAVDEESSKYVNRSPVSCNWKIYTWRAHVNTVHHQRVARVAYYVSSDE